MKARSTPVVGAPRSRLRVWLGRYLPPELAGTSSAVAAAAVATRAGAGSAVLAAAWAESAGFYAFVIVRELRVERARARRFAVVAAVRGVVAEFGVAEVGDTAFVRPLLMYAFVAPLGGLLPGVIAGKIAADIVFYALAVPAYELRERRRT